MGIASFVVGLICLILSPFLSVFLVLPSLLALVLGIIDCVIKSKKKESKGLAIAGIVLSIIALIVCILIIVLAVYVFNTASDSILNGFNTFSNEITSEIEQEDITCKVGESATINDIKVTLKSVDNDFDDYYDYASIEDGYKVIKADFEFENLKDYTTYVYDSDFRCYADQFLCDDFIYVEDSYFSEAIDSGRKAAASVYYEVPEDADTIEIEFQPSTWYTSKVIFTID